MTALLSSVFIASVLGSLHCVGMCGPFATLATARPARVRLPQVSAIASSSAYNGGRLVTYVLLGAAAGGLGLLLDVSGTAWLGVARLGTGLAGVAMLVVGLAGLLAAAGVRMPGLGALDTTRVLARFAAATASLRPHRRAAMLGALTSLMPCGWLWAFVLTAASTGTPLRGATVMLVFWAGTVPAMGLLGVGLHSITGRLGRHLPWLMPALVTLVGAYTLSVRLPAPVLAPAPTVPAASDPEPHVPQPKDAPCH